MTEAEWNISTRPDDMLECLRGGGRASERKLRLFACACVRQVWHRVVEAASRQAVQAAEQYADGQIPLEALRTARAQASVSLRGPRGAPHGALKGARATTREPALVAAREAQREVIQEVWNKARWTWQTAPAVKEAGHRQQCVLLRDLFGPLPFRPVAFDQAWRTKTAVAVAQVIYDERDFAMLPVLADALEDAGCENEEVLAHCRQQGGAHVRGCWVVDLILGKR
jgi:hypothetical protein